MHQGGLIDMSFLYTLISLLKGVTNLELVADFDTLAAGLGADCADGASSGGSVVNVWANCKRDIICEPHLIPPDPI